VKKTSIRNILILGWLIFYRDFQWRYKLTFLGYIWAVLRPLFIGLPIIIVGKRFNLAGEASAGGNYAIYAFSGLVFFRIFFDAVECPQLVMWRARRVLQAVKIPYIAIIVAACFYVLVNLVVYISLLVTAIIVFKASLQSTAYLTLFCVPLFVIAGLSIGIMFAPIALFYLDIRYSLGVLSGILMWVTPIFYEMQTDGLVGIINKWNPLTYLVSMPRYWLVGGEAVAGKGFLLSMALFSILLITSLRFYYRSLPIAVERAI
jgi:lipopolysaccharide transport system permease protein